MGYIRHRAILVTDYDEGRLAAAHAEAVRIFTPPEPDGFQGRPLSWARLVSPILASPVNGYDTFVIAPDGSKEGWPSSHEGDRRRTAFLAWAERADVRHVLVIAYGDDEPVLERPDGR